LNPQPLDYKPPIYRHLPQVRVIESSERRSRQVRIAQFGTWLATRFGIAAKLATASRQPDRRPGDDALRLESGLDRDHSIRPTIALVAPPRLVMDRDSRLQLEAEAAVVAADSEAPRSDPERLHQEAPNAGVQGAVSRTWRSTARRGRPTQSCRAPIRTGQDSGALRRRAKPRTPEPPPVRPCDLFENAATPPDRKWLIIGPRRIRPPVHALAARGARVLRSRRSRCRERLRAAARGPLGDRRHQRIPRSRRLRDPRQRRRPPAPHRRFRNRPTLTTNLGAANGVSAWAAAPIGSPVTPQFADVTNQTVVYDFPIDEPRSSRDR